MRSGTKVPGRKGTKGPNGPGKRTDPGRRPRPRGVRPGRRYRLPSTALPGSPSSVTIPLCTVTVNRAGSVKNPSAITSWVISRRISSSPRRKTLSTSDRLTMPARRPPRSTTGSRWSRRECISAGRGLHQVVRAYRHRRAGHQVARGGLAVRAVTAVMPPGRQRQQVGLGHHADHLPVGGGDRETADPVLAEHGGHLAVRGVRPDRHHAGGHDVPDVGVHGDHFFWPRVQVSRVHGLSFARPAGRPGRDVTHFIRCRRSHTFDPGRRSRPAVSFR